MVRKIWLEHYPKGIPAEINPDVYQSVVEIFEESCKNFADLPAFYNLGTTLTYQQVELFTRAFAAYLQNELKLKKGDRLAVMMPNMLQYPIVIFGALRAGVTVVNVNPLYTVPELVHLMNDAGAETIIVLANFAKTVQDGLPQMPQLKHIVVTEMGDLLSPWKAFFINFYLRYVKRKVPALTLQNPISFKDVLQKGAAQTLQPVAISHQDIAFLQYTGGTTGVAKGAMLTHRNIVANILQAQAWLESIFVPGKEIAITAIPLYHIFSLLANCMIIFKVGGYNILVTNPRDLRQMVAEISKFKFSVITGVNTLFNVLESDAKFRKLDFSALKLSLAGGAALQQAVAERWKALTGCVLLEAYGLTEASPAVTVNPPDLKAYNGTVGLPIPSTDICIFGENGSELSINEIGELGIKGPQVMLGYWNQPEETAKAFTKENWLLTGDIVRINPDGFIKILDRKKDMVLVSGFNVYPNEVEDVLVSMPGIKEAAVIGVPDEKTGEAVKAFIVKSNPNLTAEDIIKFCHASLTGYKVPQHIEFRQELPKTNVGKVLRRALKDQSKSGMVEH